MFYYGFSKPISSEQYLRLFIDELKSLLIDGLISNGRKYTFFVKGFICDAPARAFIKGIIGHNGYYACEKCFIEGEYSHVSHHVFFDDVNCTLRTNENYRLRLQEEHHKTTSILEELPIDMIKAVPLDYMHLVLLGIVKKMIKMWLSGSSGFATKLTANDIFDISNGLKVMAHSKPSEIPRKIRCLDSLHFWKATESRTFLLKSGPVVLLGKLQHIAYQHFLLLHCAITICSSVHFKHFLRIAKILINEFVKRYASIYGKEYITYNVHSLI